MVRGGGVLTGDRDSSRKKAPTAKAPRPKVEGTPPLPHLGFVPIRKHLDLVKKLDDAEAGIKSYHAHRGERRKDNIRLEAEVARTRAMPFQELADSLWHEARRFKSKVAVEVDAACKEVLCQLVSQVEKADAAAAKEAWAGAVAAAEIAQAETAEKAEAELAAAELLFEKECRAVLDGLLEQVVANAEAEAAAEEAAWLAAQSENYAKVRVRMGG
jgi:hypothetical protein